MELSKQVVSLELSKRLKELGMKKDSFFSWQYFPHTDSYALQTMPVGTGLNIAAFTVTELGHMLGRATNKNIMRAYGHVWNVPGARFCTEIGLLGCMTDAAIGAAMLIYLIENNLITLDL